jgi:hypothetical protein
MILNWAKKNLKKEKVNEFLLAMGNEGRTVFHVEVEFCKPEWVKWNLTREN